MRARMPITSITTMQGRDRCGPCSSRRTFPVRLTNVLTGAITLSLSPLLIQRSPLNVRRDAIERETRSGDLAIPRSRVVARRALLADPEKKNANMYERIGAREIIRIRRTAMEN